MSRECQECDGEVEPGQLVCARCQDSEVRGLRAEILELKAALAASPAAAELIRAAPNALRFRDAEYDALREQVATLTRERDVILLAPVPAAAPNVERAWEAYDRIRRDNNEMGRENQRLREQVERLLADGRVLHREIEKVALALNEIGWPSENAPTTDRACRAIRTLAAIRDRAK